MPIPIVGLHRHYFEKQKSKLKFSWPSGLALLHKYWGVSWVHLEHEFILLTSSLFLTTSSLMSMYRHSFPKAADLQYIMLTVLWLARYPIHRIICTTDTNSTRYGAKDGWKFFHLISSRLQWFWIFATSGGQYYDVPATIFTSSVSEDISNPSSKGEEMRYNNNIQRMNHSSLIKIFPLHLLCFVISILKWMFQIVHVGRSSKRINNTITTSGRTTKGEHQDEESFWHIYRIQLKKMEHGMSSYWVLSHIQILIFIFSLVVFSFHLYHHYIVWSLPANKLHSSNGRLVGNMNYLPSDDSSNWIPNNLRMLTRLTKMFKVDSETANAVVNKLYSWSGVFMTMMMFGCVGSLLVFGRIILPLPDLVKTTQNNTRGKLSKKRSEVPWCEKYSSIMDTDRFFLHLIVSVLRVLEYFILCFILPRSEYICKASGHCDIGISMFELGSLAIKGHRGRSMYDRLIYDMPLAWLIGFITVLIPSLVFLSATVTLDRSRLAINAFLQQAEPKMIRRASLTKKIEPTESDFDFSEFLSSNLQANKGIFSALKHFHRNLKSPMYKIFADEVGPLSTSRILSICSTIHLVMSTSIMVLFIFYYVTNRYWHPLVLLYLSFFSSAPDPGSLDYSSLKRYADHISVSHKMISEDILSHQAAKEENQ